MNERNTGRGRRLILFAAVTALSAAGCADSGGDGGGSSSTSFYDGTNWGNPTPAADSGASQEDAWAGGSEIAVGEDSGPTTAEDAGPKTQPPDPEDERDFDLRTPEASGKRIYIPSAALDALVVVDATTLTVDLVEVGAQPIAVRALPGDGGAVVLNAGSSDASIVRPGPTGREYDVITLDLPPRHNRLELSQDGAWAFAWYSERAAAPGDPVGSLQDVSAIRTLPGHERVFNLAVGMRPERLFLSDDGEVALFLCEDGISGVVLPLLDDDTFLPPVPMHDDPFVEPIDREVVVTPDAGWAVVRDLDRAELTLVDLELNERHVLALPDWPSDLDMTPDGARVVVPFKARREVAVLDVPDAFLYEPEPPADPEADPEAPTGPAIASNPHAILSYTGQEFGAVELTAGGEQGLLYTTQHGADGALAIGLLDLATGQVGTRPVPKEITAAAIAPDGATALLFHRRYSGEGAPVATSDAYSLLNLKTGFVKLVLTPQEPTGAVFTEAGDELFILLPDPWETAHMVQRVRAFAVTSYPTPAAPIYAGILAGAGKAAVMLDDPTGWLTLIDTASGSIDQINSFELNSFIR